MDRTEESIRKAYGAYRNLADRVISKMRKQRLRAAQSTEADEIRRVNDGYFVRPMSASTHEDRLPADGPEQLRLDIDKDTSR